MNEYMYTCTPVCARYAHPRLLLTLEGMLVPFLVVPTAVEVAYATLAQCPDGARETHLKYVSGELYQMYEWSILSSAEQSSGRYWVRRVDGVIDTQF